MRMAAIGIFKSLNLFLEVIKQLALLHCLSVDTFVGNLYNYMSGRNRTRAIRFFKLSLVEAHSDSICII